MLEDQQHKIEVAINALQLSSSLSKDRYADLFYDHLTGILKYRITDNDFKEPNIEINLNTYYSMQQYALENAAKMEAYPSDKKIDWRGVFNLKDKYEETIKRKFGSEINTSRMKSILEFSSSVFEKYVIYESLYPDSLVNPWIPTKEIALEKGFLFLVSDNQDQVKEYETKILDKYSKVSDNDRNNLFLIASGEQKGKFSGFFVDKRNNMQNIVYEYIREMATGAGMAKNKKDILSFLEKHGIVLDEPNLTNKVLLPLKRAGLIGSSTNGFFDIVSDADLIESMNHHYEKLIGIKRTLYMYSIKAKKRNIDVSKYEM